MKIRQGFVSNSSSSSFIIINTSDKPLSFLDFIKENPQFTDYFTSQPFYGNRFDYTHRGLIAQCIVDGDDKYILQPGQDEDFEFSDEGDAAGTILRTALSNGGKSENFEWIERSDYDEYDDDY